MFSLALSLSLSLSLFLLTIPPSPPFFRFFSSAIWLGDFENQLHELKLLTEFRSLYKNLYHYLTFEGFQIHKLRFLFFFFSLTWFFELFFHTSLFYLFYFPIFFPSKLVLYSPTSGFFSSLTVFLGGIFHTSFFF